MVGMTAGGNMRQSFGSDGIALYLDCADGYLNVHVTEWHRTIHTIVLRLIFWF